MEAGGEDGRMWMMVRGGTGPQEGTGAEEGWRDKEEKVEREGEGGDQGGEASGRGKKKRDTGSAGDRGDVGKRKFSRPGTSDFSR